MRSHSGGERTLMGGTRLGIHAKVECANENGTLIDVSTFVASIRVDKDIDNPAARCTLTLIREYGASPTTNSLAPFMAASLLNRNNAAAYAPLLNPNRRVVVSTAVTQLGTAPVSGDWRVLFNGFTDDVNWGQSPLTVELRDGIKPLLDTIIEVERTYGNNTTPVAVQTVMQSIITDNITVNPPTLVTPVSPNWVLKEFTQARVSVYDAIRALALQIGWDVRMRWNGSTEQLQLYSPNRSASSPVATFGPSEYIDIPSLAISSPGGNACRVYYPSALTGNIEFEAAQDSASIAAYGRFYFEIGEDHASNVDTAAEAQAMATAAIADVGQPRTSQDCETIFFWPVELGDFYGFLANATHYDSQQNLAVVGFTHLLEGGSGTTVLRCSGKPAGAFDAWLNLPRTATPAGSLEYLRVTLAQGAVTSQFFEVIGTVSDPLGTATPVFGTPVTSNIAVPITGSNPWVVRRPLPGFGPGQFRVTATATDRYPDSDSIEIPEEGRDTVPLASRVTVIAQTDADITVRVHVIDPYPLNDVSLAYTKSANIGALSLTSPQVIFAVAITNDFFTTGFRDFVVPRPTVGAGQGAVTFTATATGRVQASDPVYVAERASGAVVVVVTATMTSATPTTITVSVSAVDPLGLVSPAIQPPTAQNLIGAITGTNPYVIPRNVTGAGRVYFSATVAGRIAGSTFIDVPDQSVSIPTLTIRADQIATTPADATYRVRVADTGPGANISLSYVQNGTGGVTPGSPQTIASGSVTNDLASTGFVDFTVTRPNGDQNPGRVSFLAQATGRVQATVPIDIQPQFQGALALRVDTIFQDDAEMIVRVLVTDQISLFPITIEYQTANVGGVSPATGRVISGGVTSGLFNTAQFIDFTIQKPPIGTGTGLVNFTATANKRSQAVGTVVVPEKGVTVGGVNFQIDSVALDSSASDTIKILFTASGLPGGCTIDLEWSDNMYHLSDTVIANIANTGSYTHLSSGAGGHGYDLLSSGGLEIEFKYRLRLRDAFTTSIGVSERTAKIRANTTLP